MKINGVTFVDDRSDTDLAYQIFTAQKDHYSGLVTAYPHLCWGYSLAANLAIAALLCRAELRGYKTGLDDGFGVGYRQGFSAGKSQA